MTEITSQEIAQLWDKTREIKKVIQEALPDKELEFSVGMINHKHRFNFYLAVFYISPDGNRDFARDVGYDELSQKMVNEIANYICKEIKCHCKRCGL